MTDYPALQYLFGVYFHQDWRADYGDEWHALNEFVAADPEDARELPGEIRALLRRTEGESDLKRLVIDKWESSYLVDRVGLTYGDWLTSVADRVERRLAEPPSLPVPDDHPA